MAAPALPREVQKLREQLTRDQAPSARTRTEYFDPNVFVNRHGRPYSSLRLPISTLVEMRTDAILRFAQLTALVSIFSAKWHISCGNARKAAFIDQALRRVIGRLIIQFFESWNFGWQALVKEFGLMVPSWEFIDRDAEGGPKAAPVWDGGPEVPALVWEPFVPLRPHSVAPVWTAGGAFNGIALAKSGVSGAYAFPTTAITADDVIDVPRDIAAFFNDQDSDRVKVDVDHSLWVVNERDSQWGSVWGYPRLGYAYKYWWNSELTLGILARSVERKGDPTIVVTYPQGNSRVGDQDVPNQTIAFDIGNKARSGSVLAVPSEVWGEDTGTSNQASKWGVTYLKAEENFDKLTHVLDYFDTMKFRSMLVSELALAEGTGGSSSRNVAATTGERTAEAQIFAQNEWDEIINRYMIPQLADANFPELKDEPARKVTQAFGQDEAALAADLLRSFANADPTKLPMDLPALLARFQIDSLSGKDLAEWQQRMIDQAENSQPPEVPAQPNGAAGTTDTGFGEVHYYDAPERIELEDALLASLPKTKHYADRAVLTQTRRVRKLWFDLLSAQYEDFASHVAGLDLAESKAEKIVGAWRYTAKKYEQTVKALSKSMSTIFARAGAVELSSSKLDPATFDPTNDTLSSWVTANVAAMVRGVEETTRKQLASFLSREFERGSSPEKTADAIREHFATFPAWRADLIARCLPADAVVDAAVVRAATRRWYEGDMVTVVTESGREFTATPNHPMLAGSGWTALGDLQEGDYLVRDARQEHAGSVGNEHVEERPTSVGDLFAATASVGVVERRRGSDDDFHGDGIEGDVDIARPDGLLHVGAFSPLDQPSAEQVFAVSDDASSAFCRGCGTLLGDDALGFCDRPECDSALYQNTLDESRRHSLSGGDLRSALTLGVQIDDRLLSDVVSAPGMTRAGEATGGSVAQAAYRDASATKFSGHRRGVDSSTSSGLMSAESGQVKVDRIVERRSRSFRGHVYNLCTPYGYFVSEGFFTGNTEVHKFYNAATLFAAEAAGSDQVQALDGQLGPTDPDCERRHGRLFSVQDAWRESAREHVRGTLGWRILPPNVQLCLRYVSRDETRGVAARIDPGESTIHLVEGLAPDVEGQYLDQVVSWFIATR